MKYGFVLPYGDARAAADLAEAAEQAGWDGFFVWETLYGWDAWLLLAAAAMRTERIRLGTLLTPPSRMRPWKLASECLTLDHLSGGRATLAVGLGAIDTGFAEFGEVTERKTRAELLDESLEIITGLWRGEPISFSGKHYTIRPSSFMLPPPPVQQPRIPIWVVGAWPHRTSMLRALRYDGLLPHVSDGDGKHRPLIPADLREMRDFVAAERAEQTPFDMIVEGVTPGDNPQAAADIVSSWAAAGATWWVETLWDAIGKPNGLEIARTRIAQGPPQIA